jgi:hypothetical protein
MIMVAQLEEVLASIWEELEIWPTKPMSLDRLTPNIVQVLYGEEHLLFKFGVYGISGIVR